MLTDDEPSFGALVAEYAEATQEVFVARDGLREYLRRHGGDPELARLADRLFAAVTRLVRTESRITASHLDFIRELREAEPDGCGSSLTSYLPVVVRPDGSPVSLEVQSRGTACGLRRRRADGETLSTLSQVFYVGHSVRSGWHHSFGKIFCGKSWPGTISFIVLWRLQNRRLG